MVRRIKRIISIALCAFALASCAMGNTASSWDLTSKKIDIIRGANANLCPAAAKERGNTLAVGSTDFNGVFNPLFAETAYDMAVTANIFGFLIEPDYDAKPIPGMADFSVSSDGLAYTLRLKKGVSFSDGRPVTAKDIEFTLYVLSDPSYNGPADIGSINIVGYSDFHQGSADMISGIKVIDDNTIEIRLERPNAQAIWLFSTGVLSRDYYGRDYTKGNLEGIRGLNGKPMGAGPYRLVDYKPGKSITLAANEKYYKGPPKISGVVYLVTPIDQEIESMGKGETDIAFLTVSPDNIQAAEDKGFIDIYRYPANGYGYIGFNDQDPRYSDKRVRQALMTALNR